MREWGGKDEIRMTLDWWGVWLGNNGCVQAHCIILSTFVEVWKFSLKNIKRKKEEEE